MRPLTLSTEGLGSFGSTRNNVPGKGPLHKQELRGGKLTALERGRVGGVGEVLAHLARPLHPGLDNH
eukprot:8456098-Pyramimonas_sp.AAC.1